VWRSEIYKLTMGEGEIMYWYEVKDAEDDNVGDVSNCVSLAQLVDCFIRDDGVVFGDQLGDCGTNKGGASDDQLNDG